MNFRIPFAAADLPQLFGSVKVGERGQVVIPQEARNRMGIRPGEKLLALGGLPGGAGLFLIKPETFNTFLAEIMAKLNSVDRMLHMVERGDEAPIRDASSGSAPKRTRRSRA